MVETAGVRQRPRVEGGREEEILDATVAVVAEMGYDRLTMDAVATAAKASKATLYRRWTTKAELVVDAISRAKGCPIPEDVDTGSLRGDLISMSVWRRRLHRRAADVGDRRSAHRPAPRPELQKAFQERFLAPRQHVVATVYARPSSAARSRRTSTSSCSR
jgi:AcrR family transcriptional regulator